ncbi:type I restriction endonuclease [Enterococcus plantarum]|uniref:Type I restriction endonuclease n=2 Tax=Enterococcus plantarum TaxID=1077675 RepID=A0A2W3Z3C6_9ENTE|nr:type I restriction endonuclease [Enterococcus plantarum]
MEEQKRIVQKIEELFKKIDQYAEAYNKLEELNKQFPIKMEKSLLQYAMQGKLVPQNPSDEPASELLKQIKAEKEQLIKDKKIKKEKPLPEITEEEIPFEIPESWEWRRLREFSVITSGGTPKTAISEYWEGNIPWITPKDMGKQREKYIKSSSKKITDYGLEKSSAQLIRKNSIVYSSRAPIGHINIVPFDYTTNQGCKSVSPIRINIEYLYYSLIMMTPNIIKRGSGTTFKEVSATTFGETLIPIPPLNEQIRIIRELENIVKTVNNLKI